MLVATVAKYERPDDWVHSEKKGGKQFMLTETASSAIDVIAKRLGISRSEVVERAARCGGMEAATKFNSETGDCTNGCS
ncbi:MAG: ribbon-helix-helix domain-containing protein [Chroococcidiopsis sp.]